MCWALLGKHKTFSYQKLGGKINLLFFCDRYLVPCMALKRNVCMYILFLRVCRIEQYHNMGLKLKDWECVRFSFALHQYWTYSFTFLPHSPFYPAALKSGKFLDRQIGWKLKQASSLLKLSTSKYWKKLWEIFFFSFLFFCFLNYLAQLSCL